MFPVQIQRLTYSNWKSAPIYQHILREDHWLCTVLGPPHAKSWLIGKDSDAGMDWGQEEKGLTEDEMAGWHHGLDGRGFEWAPGDGDGQGGLACCDSWGCKESDTTEQLNWRCSSKEPGRFNKVLPLSASPLSTVNPSPNLYSLISSFFLPF